MTVVVLSVTVTMTVAVVTVIMRTFASDHDEVRCGRGDGRV
jgi:hypothetical protein